MFSAGKTALPLCTGPYMPMCGSVSDADLEALGLNGGVFLGDGMTPEVGFMCGDGFSLEIPSDVVPFAESNVAAGLVPSATRFGSMAEYFFAASGGMESDPQKTSDGANLTL